MSLTDIDLFEIRSILREELTIQIEPLHGEVEALRNDIKEIYAMIADLQKETSTSKSFKKSSLEEKILRLHADLVEAAEQANVTLPSR